MRLKGKIGLIGCGNMGEAILRQGLKSKIGDFIIFEKNTSRQKYIFRKYKAEKAKDISDLVARCRIIIIAVKPQDIDSVLDEIARAGLKKERKILIVSIAAGITTKYIENKISDKNIAIVRTMPNMPAQIGRGITALSGGRFAKGKDLKIAEEIFKAVGKTIIVQEKFMDVITALSGSGPAYLSFIFLSMRKVAERLGLTREKADVLIYHMISGATELLNKNKFDAQGLISKVASRGGTTEAALKVFKNKKLDEVIGEAIVAAFLRAKELSKKRG
jgi:pyrroline-5-carboxylate reductase